MLKIKINDIAPNAAASEECYNWLQERLGEWLNVYSIDWARNGVLNSISVYTESSVVVIFVDEYLGRCDYELDIVCNKNTHCRPLYELLEVLSEHCKECKNEDTD